MISMDDMEVVMDQETPARLAPRVIRLESEIGQVKSELGSIRTGLLHVSTTLDKVADRVNAPQHVNWGWIISSIMGVLLIAGGYTNIVTEPLKKSLEANGELHRVYENRIRELEINLSYTRGRSGREE